MKQVLLAILIMLLSLNIQHVKCQENIINEDLIISEITKNDNPVGYLHKGFPRTSILYLSSRKIKEKYGKDACPFLLKAGTKLFKEKKWDYLKKVIVTIGLLRDTSSKLFLLNLIETKNTPHSVKLLSLDVLMELELKNDDINRILNLRKCKDSEIRIFCFAIGFEKTKKVSYFKDFLDEITFSTIVTQRNTLDRALWNSHISNNGWIMKIIKKWFKSFEETSEMPYIISVLYDKLPYINYCNDKFIVDDIFADKKGEHILYVNSIVNGMKKSIVEKDRESLREYSKKIMNCKGGYLAAYNLMDIILDDTIWGKNNKDRIDEIRLITQNIMELSPQIKSPLMAIIVKTEDIRSELALEALCVMLGTNTTYNYLKYRALIEKNKNDKEAIERALNLINEKWMIDEKEREGSHTLPKSTLIQQM